MNNFFKTIVPNQRSLTFTFKRKLFSISFTLLALALSVRAGKPNFIIIFTDDQGYADLSCFGSKDIKTPYIDRMAKEGRKFKSFYMASSICTPSRAALMTGCYPKRVGLASGVIHPKDKHGLHEDEVTIADMLKTAGYTTACIGKWHLGHQNKFLPTNQGFDYFYGIPYSNDMKHPSLGKKPSNKFDQSWLEPEKMTQKWGSHLMENEKIIELPCDQRTITRRYTDKAIEFVTANKDNPFFLYLPHSIPHVPLFVPDDIYDPNLKNAYKTVIEHIDTETGRLMNTIRKLGLDKNTYVIYTSDNGPTCMDGHHGGKATPLLGGKRMLTEGGFRVPCIMWAPGRIPANTETNAFTSALDLLPTLANLAGINLETRGPIDGLDITNILYGDDQSPRQEMLYYSRFGQLRGLRQGDWKMVMLSDDERLSYEETVKRGRKFISKDVAVKPYLFNLAQDIDEKTNLKEMIPDKYDELYQRMLELDKEMNQEIRLKGMAE